MSGETPPSDRAARERHAYDEARVWDRCHRVHRRFAHVFESPNTSRGERLFEHLLAERAAGRRVLEIGCAEGRLSRRALDLGAAYVLGTDVAESFLDRARAHAIPGRLEYAAFDVHRPVPGRFDVIVGRSVLHHLDWRGALERLHGETLSPGGTMLFLEPLGSNLLIRAWWRVGRSAHTPDERPFSRADLAWLRRRFPALRLHGINYLSLPAGILSSLVLPSADNALLRACDRVDRQIERRLPWLIPRFRQALLVIEKP